MIYEVDFLCSDLFPSSFVSCVGTSSLSACVYQLEARFKVHDIVFVKPAKPLHYKGSMYIDVQFKDKITCKAA